MSNAAKSLDAPERTAGGVWDNPMQTDGFEFVEFTSPQPVELGRLFETLGFTAVARHRSKNVTPYRQGDVNFILRSEEHTSELQSLMRTSYAVFCLKKTKKHYTKNNLTHNIQ